MFPDAEVHLRGAPESDALHDVHEQSDLDTPPFDEGHLLEQRALTRVLAAQRLDEAGEFWEQHGEQRARNEFGDPSATGRLTMQRTAVVALDERDVGVGDQRSEQPADEVMAEVADIGIHPADDVASRCVQGLPHCVALAAPGSGLGQDVVDGDNARALPGRDLGGRVQ